MAIELGLQTRTGSSDFSKEQRTQRFYVDRIPDDALNDPQLPPLGTAYPAGNPNTLFPMRLERYDVSVVPETGMSYVDCVYSSDRSARIRPVPDKTRPGYQGIETDFQDTSSDLPSILTFPLKIPGLNIIESETPGVEAKVYKIAETLTIHQVTVPISAPTTQQMAAIGIQNNRLHKFSNGRVYRYKAGSVKQSETSTWEASHTWIEDLGTPFPTGMFLPFSSVNTQARYRYIGPPTDKRIWYFPQETINLLKFIDPLINDPLLYVRSPYHVVTYALWENLEPEFTQYCPLRYDANGWQSLPGGLNL